MTEPKASQTTDGDGRIRPEDTLGTLFLRSAAEDPTAVALSGNSATFTWQRYREITSSMASGWRALGLGPGDAVALLIGPSPEFHLVDTSVLLARGVPFSLSPEDPSDRHGLLLRLSGARVIVTAPEHLKVAHAAAADAGSLGIRVVLLGSSPAASSADTASGAVSLEEVVQAGRASQLPDAGPGDPEDIATLIFTSGTTGTPKGVRLSHRAIVSSLASTDAIAPIGVGGKVLSFLPTAHIAERFMSHYQGLAFRLSIRSVADPATLYDEVLRVRPDRFFAVPRVYEKLAATTHRLIEAAGLSATFKASLDHVRREQETGQHGSTDEQDQRLALLAPIRAELGLERTEYRGVATAPSSSDILELFSAIGLPVGNIWGMSEAIMCTMNPPEKLKLSSVGILLDGVEGSIDADGEILIRGRNLYSGYLPGPDTPEDPVDEHGWLHTGDLGVIDEGGYLSVTGRKKDLMVTATGANIAPAQVEGALVGATDLVAHVMAVADRRRFVTAVVGLDEDALIEFASVHGLEGGVAQLSRHPAVHQEIERAVAEANAHLPKAARIRGFLVADRLWQPGGPEITPTMKLRRPAVLEEYAEQIDALYR
ncbi:long-chain fatty acid--CoA ligase [Citricoccus sp. K5]|uniref:AMP-dependent synthetase/ligase n=1 Tax=Citricoccus sp. K5 TaxID=2653135 RepID=UPI00135C98DB|nr:AMP-binding protein [Citricoccus sp. K5]